MDLLSIVKELENSENFVETKNYYFENHLCGNENKKVELEYTISNDKSDEIVRFGFCKDCNKCFYHKDFETKGF